MRQSGSEKLETIRVVEDSELSVTATLRELGVLGARSTAGIDGTRHVDPPVCWIGIPDPASAGTRSRNRCVNR